MANEFRKCFKAQLLKALKSKTQVNNIIKRYDDKVADFRAKGNDLEGANKAAEDFIRGEQSEKAFKQRQIQRYLVERQEVMDRLGNTPGPLKAKVEGLIQRSAWRGNAIEETTLTLMDSELEKLAVNMMGNNKDIPLMLESTLILFGKKNSDNLSAVNLAKGMRKTMEYSHGRGENAGMRIGHLDNFFPTGHRRELIFRDSKGRKIRGRENIAAKKKEWVENTLRRSDVLDMDNAETGMKFRNKEELRPVYEDMIDKIYSQERSGPGFGGDIDAKNARSRFIKWLTPEDAMDHNRQYGSGDAGLQDTFLSYIKGMSRDTGILEVYTSKPNALNKELVEMVKTEVQAEGLGKGAEGDAKSVELQYKALTSQLDRGDTENLLYKFIMGWANVEKANMLTSANISALSDSAFVVATMRGNGLPVTNALKNNLAALLPGTNTTKKIARENGAGSKLIMMALIQDSRMAAASRTKGITSKMAAWVNILSGLSRMTNATKMGSSVTASIRFGDYLNRKLSWKQIGEAGMLNIEGRRFQESLAAFGFVEDDWNWLLKHAGESVKMDGVPFFTKNQLRFKKHANPDDLLRAIEISDNIGDYQQMLEQVATNESTIKTQVITAGAAGKGTIRKAAAAAVFMFKTFPLSVWFTHTSKGLKKTFGRQSSMTNRMDGAEELLHSTILAGIIGVGVVQLKQLKEGKDMMDWWDVKLWIRGLMQGGGMGFPGDMLFGGSSRFGRSVGEELEGPLLAAVGDILTVGSNVLGGAFASNPQERKKQFDKARKNAFKTVMRNFANFPMGMWYSRLIMNRMFVDGWERVANPNVDEDRARQENRMIRETGQEFWWPPGQPIRRAPKVATEPIE